MKYKRMSQEEAEPGWNEVFEASLDSCMHGAYCQQGADCQVSLPARLPLGALKHQDYGTDTHPRDLACLC